MRHGHARPMHQIIADVEAKNKSEHSVKLPVLSSTVEFCYRWPDGRIEVRYRRVDGTEECAQLKAEHEQLKARLGDDCPYFWRIA